MRGIKHSNKVCLSMIGECTVSVCVRQKVPYLNIRLPDESSNCLQKFMHINVVIDKINRTIVRTLENSAMYSTA